MEKEKNKKKKSIFGYFIKMVIAFMFIVLIQYIMVGIIGSSILLFKYGSEIIAEAISAVVILIVLLLYKNKYIFTEKREKLLSGLKMGWPFLTVGFIILLVNGYNFIFESDFVIEHRLLNLLNVIVFCILIGITEEFLCRGWLLNEFLERYGDNKKGIITSIVLSSLVFGVMHFGNIGTQDLVTTFFQVISAALTGISFGLIYYKTRNIWSVIVLHGFWDFAIFVGESGYLVDCTEGEVTKGVLIALGIQLILCIGAYLLYNYLLLTKTDLISDEKKASKGKKIIIIIFMMILWLGSLFYVNDDYNNYNICPVYEAKHIDSEKAVMTYMYDSFDISYQVDDQVKNYNSGVNFNSGTVYRYRLYINDEGKAYFKNLDSNEEILLVDDYIRDLLIIENDDTYAIMLEINTLTDKVLYAVFDKNKMSGDKEYLEIVKSSLKEYLVPSIDSIGIMTIRGSNYKYPLIITDVSGRLYFDKDGELYHDYNNNKKNNQ